MSKTSFQYVKEMNEAFGNPEGDFWTPDWERLGKQVRNVLDEYAEALEAIAQKDRTKLRDALCDIQVFAMGAQHMLGVDGDRDMEDVLDGVMTRFVKDDADLAETIKWHASKGVTLTYVEGDYPRKILKSSADQPDAPKGKFLKSASYRDTVFRAVPETGIANGGEDARGG